jgi:hypothetical protein
MRLNSPAAAIAALCIAVGILYPATRSLADGDLPPPPTVAQLTPPYYVFNSNIPSDIVTIGLGANGTQPFVDNLAWNTFLAVSWPAPQPLTERGVPNRQNVTGGLKYGAELRKVVMPTGPVVWETFKDTNDIFMPTAAKPAAFDAPPAIPAACAAAALKDPTAALHILRDTTQAFTGHPLIDQNGQMVWYEVKLNRAYYDYVVNNGFYDSRKQKGKTIDFPISSNNTLQAPVVKVKAAWMIMTTDQAKSGQFYTVPALLFDQPANTCVDQKVGLVGLHVVQKTEQFQQWAWATFEHVNNAPDTPVTEGHFNFYNPACTPAQCPQNTYPSKSGPNGPTQVVREVPVDNSAVNANKTFQAALKTLRSDNVWQYYMLVDSQWGPLNAQLPLGKPAQPNFLANTTMETYLQSPQEANPPHGCINCHAKAGKGKADMDFQLSKAYPHDKQTQILLREAFMH